MPPLFSSLLPVFPMSHSLYPPSQVSSVPVKFFTLFTLRCATRSLLYILIRQTQTVGMVQDGDIMPATELIKLQLLRSEWQRDILIQVSLYSLLIFSFLKPNSELELGD